VLNLDKFKKNSYSANGEDGILQYLISNIPHNSPLYVVEFGAADGIESSNTLSFIKSGAKAILIEGNRSKYELLEKNMQKYPEVSCVNCYVAIFKDETRNTLENILISYGWPKDFDILSIDIDSNDALIFATMKDYFPKIVVIELNPYYLPGVKFFSTSKISGNSFSTILEIFLNKNYTLVAHTGSNLIFVRNEFFKFTGLDEFVQIYPEILFDTSFIQVDREVPETISRWLNRASARYLRLKAMLHFKHEK
jgi:hypothetical protein